MSQLPVFPFSRQFFKVFRIERGILKLKIFTFHSMLKTSQDNFRDNFRDNFCDNFCHNFFPSESGSRTHGRDVLAEPPRQLKERTRVVLVGWRDARAAPSKLLAPPPDAVRCGNHRATGRGFCPAFSSRPFVRVVCPNFLGVAPTLPSSHPSERGLPEA